MTLTAGARPAPPADRVAPLPFLGLTFAIR
jgi:hypothetical protein